MVGHWEPVMEWVEDDDEYYDDDDDFGCEWCGELSCLCDETDLIERAALAATGGGEEIGKCAEQ